jgi:NitT/TauT family transport system permease protein
MWGLRRAIPFWQQLLLGILCIALVLGLWWLATSGDPENRLVSRYALPRPAETFASFPMLWSERYLTLNTVASLRRVLLGFGLATLIGIPIGVICGCFPRANSFFVPLTTFGRNIPIAALIPLMFGLFGIGEFEKIMFIFIACVAFVIFDTARAVLDVGTPYIDTSYTLGASRWQIIRKVLFPLAMPSVFNSLRLLFGLAFGYIMLAELVKYGGESGGLGDLIEMSQRQGPREHIILILLIIPILALGIDRALYWVQKELFPYRYGGSGVLHQWLVMLLHACEDCISLFRRRPTSLPVRVPSQSPSAPAKP